MHAKRVRIRLPGRRVGPLRIGSSNGLGNLLFPWARAVVFAREQRLPVEWPVWPQIQIGAWIRRERDRRLYAGLFRRPGGWERSRARAPGRTFGEGKSDEFLGFQGVASIEFEGVGSGFAAIAGRAEQVRRELVAMSVLRFDDLRNSSCGSVGVHVRLGDMAAIGLHTTVQWFERRLLELRHLVPSIPVTVFSDGSDEELAPLLRIPGVERHSTSSNALADIALMSGVDLLIVGRGSSFGRWGAYLGGMPVLAHCHDDWWRGSWKSHPARAVCLVEAECPSSRDWSDLLEGFGQHRVHR